MISIGSLGVITINSLNLVVQLPLLAEGFIIEKLRLVMILLSFFIMVVIMFRLRRIGSTVGELYMITNLSKITYQPLSMLMG